MSPSKPSSSVRQRYRYPLAHRDVVFGVGLLVLTVAQASVRYFRLLIGDTSLHPDAELVWRPLAQAVHSGSALYVEPAVDNKPPLFEFLNILVAATDAYTFTFLLAVALVNGLSACLLYHLFVRHRMWRTGAVAATVFVLVVPLVSGHAVNVRSFAVCAFLVALSTRRAAVVGIAMAVAVLFSQYLVFGIPVACWWALCGRPQPASNRRWLKRFFAALACVVAGAYGAVLAVWGWPSFAGSLYWSVGIAGEYFTAYGPSVWVGQRAWRIYTLGILARLWPLLILTAVGARAVIGKHVPTPDRAGARCRQLLSLITGAAGIFGVLLFVRPYETYWLYPLPWFAALSAIGLRIISRRAGLGTLA